MRRLLLIIVAMALTPAGLQAAATERFPAPDFKSGYTLPRTVVSPVQSPMWDAWDTALLLGALGLAAWLVYTRRSRRWVFLLMLASLFYFGFWREGCICPIGSIQNVAYSAGENGYALPWFVAAFFALPLLFVLFYGRVFCAGVCPLGAIQDVVLWKPIHIPSWVEHALGLFAYAYLGLAVMYAVIGSDFIICRYDPFVSFFRLSGAPHMLYIGAVILIGSMFVGRIYCRFICPYGVLLRLLSPFSRKQVSITPKDCVDCRLCEQSCPFGAIRYPTPRDTALHTNGSRRQLQWAMAALPVIVLLFAAVGFVSSGVLSRADSTIRLAEELAQNPQATGLEITSAQPLDTQRKQIANQVKAFRGTGQSTEDLFKTAARIQRKYALGGAIFGTWMGLVVGLKIIGLILRRRRTGYTADPGACLACARCFESCPVEREQKVQREEELIAV